MRKLGIFNEEKSYIRAKKRVAKLKGFYWHLACYFFVNGVISAFQISSNIQYGQTLEEVFNGFHTYASWLFWGIGLLIHAFNVFGISLFFGRKWEEEKIKEYME